MKLTQIDLAQVYPLRHSTLRAGQPIETCYYPEDTLTGVFHMGAFDNQKQLIAIASFYPQDCPQIQSEKAYRLRGMACEELFQRQGVGSQLLQKSFDICLEEGADLLWCNARSSALSFYQKLGFKKVGSEFEIENIGPHYIMSKPLS